MKSVGYEPEGADEVRAAIAASPDPQAFEAELGTALADIASGPRQHPRVRGTPFRECILPNLPFSIIYDETDSAIQVIAFSHLRRKRGYWKKRLRPN